MTTSRSWQLLLCAIVVLPFATAQAPRQGNCPAGKIEYDPLSFDTDPTHIAQCCDAGYADTGATCTALVDFQTGQPAWRCEFTQATSLGSPYFFTLPTPPAGATTYPVVTTVNGANGGACDFGGGGFIGGGMGAGLQGTLDAVYFASRAQYQLTVYVGTGGGTGSLQGLDIVGGAGGGFSSVGTSALFTPGIGQIDDRLVVAGGGGGAGCATPQGSPNGGSASGTLPGVGGNGGGPPGSGGTGGTLTSGGVRGGTGVNAGVSAGGARGGNAGGQAGGGGGAGLWGGGGGGSFDNTNYAGDGGGGSSLIPNPATQLYVTSPFVDFGPGTGARVQFQYVPTNCGPVPTAAAGRNKARKARRALQQQLARAPYCPADKRACPLPSGNFECLEMDELTSCGGCVSEGTGVDCLEWAGMAPVMCYEGKCVMH